MKDSKFTTTFGKEIAIYTIEPKIPAIASINIFHGASEHALRYREAAEALAEKGFYVVMHDHLGHGHTKDVNKDVVIFDTQNGAQKLLDTCYEVYQYTHKAHPELPHFAIAHSMGSLIIRALNHQHNHLFDGIVYIGSPIVPSFKLRAVRFLAKIVKRLKGDLHVSRLITNLTQNQAFESMRKRGLIEHRYEWATSNVEVQNQSRKDPLIGLPFTISAQVDLFTIILMAHQSSAISNHAQLHYILCGDEDALCNYGESAQRLSELYLQQGYTNVRHKVYPNARHELLNEPIKKTVLDDIIEHLMVIIKSS